MSLTIQPPWPPDDPALALPYDQRGACFPWGPCGRVEKLQLRYTCIGVSDDGPINDIYQDLKTGQLLVMVPEASGRLRGEWYGYDAVLPPPATLELYNPSDDLSIWIGKYDLTRFAGTDPFTVTAIGVIDSLFCEDGFRLDVTFCDGVPQRPDFIFIKPLRWWQPSPYAWG